MSTESALNDAAARARALNVATSFIVQAPAGSGKTELLIRRFLALLATVEEPEAVLAITFTRKAAAEMRRRIVVALREAARDDADASSPTLALARSALRTDASRGWRILGNPSRLRILTIDALNLSLARRLPVLSGIGAGLGIDERPQPLYRAAAERLLTYLTDANTAAAAAVARLLMHLDNRPQRLIALIEELLGRREDWLAVLRQLPGDRDGDALRTQLEAARGALVGEHLQRLWTAFPPEALRAAEQLARQEAQTLSADDRRQALSAYADDVRLPSESPATNELWCALADLLLTDNGSWRQRFPSSIKPAATALVAEIAQVPELATMLDATRRLPPARYEESEWQALVAMFDVLPLAAQELQLEFAAAGNGDYPCFAAAARQALGTDDEPTDVALALDTRLRHLLVDEFQDTSLAQVRLLERLTAEWLPGDGNTLFLVGDPMQSIYRFRNAEVGQFLAAREQGIGRLPLEPLTLSVNFRSTAPVIDWHNASFARVMPAADDLRRGAVAFAASAPAPGANTDGGVVVHAFLRRSRAAEATRVGDIVEQARSRNPAGSIAVLVAGRSHLLEIVAELQRRTIAFQATDIDPLAERPVVLDLLSLTRALAHQADRTAWFAVLRAPWCGLELAGLLAIHGDDAQPVLDRLRGTDWRTTLEPEAVVRVERLLEVLEQALEEVRHVGLRDAVERAWHALGGPATVTTERELDEAAAYLEQLSALEAKTRGPLDFGRLEEVLAELYAPVDPRPDIDVQLLTVHKAKGLQFDTVIVPGLDRALRGNETGLLRWTQLRRGSNEAIVVAPVQAHGDERNALYTWLDGIARDQDRHERERLLYVAATRARSALHLLGSVAVVTARDGTQSVRAPQRSTALGILWPAVHDVFAHRLAVDGAPPGETAAEFDGTVMLRRLPSGWSQPRLPAGPRIAASQGDVAVTLLTPEFDWVSETARRVGSVVHRALQRWAQSGSLPEPDAIAAAQPLFRVELAELGVPQQMQPAAVERVVQALRQIIVDPRGRWLFDPAHHDAAAELALTGRIRSDIVSIAIDRTFVDAAGVRWIVDYKTSVHEGGGLDEFLDNEEARYRPQLERYAQFVRRIGPEPIRGGLYFPMLGAWREWSLG